MTKNLHRHSKRKDGVKLLKDSVTETVSDLISELLKVAGKKISAQKAVIFLSPERSLKRDMKEIIPFTIEVKNLQNAYEEV